MIRAMAIGKLPLSPVVGVTGWGNDVDSDRGQQLLVFVFISWYLCRPTLYINHYCARNMCIRGLYS